MTYDELAKEIHDDAVAHGWWDTERSVDECIALMHCELSEAVEELRNGHAVDEIYYNKGKPEGFAVEIADCVIRVLDFSAHNNIKADSVCKEYDIDIITKKIMRFMNSVEVECSNQGAGFVTLLHAMLSKAYTEHYIGHMIRAILYIDIFLKTYGINLTDVMRLKMNYNKTRPYKHGKEF